MNLPVSSNRKGGLRRPFALYFNSIKWDGFTTPTIFRFYLQRRNGVTRWCWRLRYLTARDRRVRGSRREGPRQRGLLACGRRKQLTTENTEDTEELDWAPGANSNRKPISAASNFSRSLVR